MTQERAYKQALESFDIEDLNMYEKVQFEILTNSMSKFDALNRIIEEASFEEDLNPALAEIALTYEKF